MNALDHNIDVKSIVVNALGIEGKEGYRELTARCPTKDHEDNNPSWSINLSTGLWICRGCGSSGDLPRLVSIMEGISCLEAVERLKKPGGAFLVSMFRSKISEAHRASQPPMKGPYDPEPLDYLRGRGFNDETLAAWGARFVKEDSFETSTGGSFTIKDNIALPIMDSHGKLVSWIYRTTTPGKTKLRYIYLPHTPVNKYWFGMQLATDTSEVVVTEGPLDAMWCHQHDMQAVACMGSIVSDTKISWLKRFSKVTVMADNDAAGVKMAHDISDRLCSDIPVSVGRYPKQMRGADPCSLTGEQLKESSTAMSISGLQLFLRSQLRERPLRGYA